MEICLGGRATEFESCMGYEIDGISLGGPFGSPGVGSCLGRGRVVMTLDLWDEEWRPEVG